MNGWREGEVPIEAVKAEEVTEAELARAREDLIRDVKDLDQWIVVGFTRGGQILRSSNIGGDAGVECFQETARYLDEMVAALKRAVEKDA